MSAVIQVKRINGKPAHRLEGSPEGAWFVSNSPIDAILEHVERELGIKRGFLLDAVDIPAESISRCRKDQQRIVDGWLLRLQMFSGIPVSELLKVACIEHDVFPHAKARRAA